MWIWIAIVVGVAILFASLYNTLVGLKNRVENVSASINVLLKKRYDLIPELVSTVKTYMQYEQKTLMNIAAIRSRAVSSNVTPEGRIELENRLSKELGNLLVSVEAYPELKANQNFLDLQKSLNEVEEQLSAARRFYNTSVTNYNNAIEMLPTNLLAAIMNYRRKKLFETPTSEQQKVRVGNLFNQ